MKIKINLFAKIFFPLLLLTLIPLFYFTVSTLPKMNKAKKTISTLKVEDEKENILLASKRAMKLADEGIRRDLLNCLFISIILFLAFFTLWYFRVYMPVLSIRSILKNLFEGSGNGGLSPQVEDEIEYIREGIANLIDQQAALGDGKKKGTEIASVMNSIEQGLTRFEKGDLSVVFDLQGEQLERIQNGLNRLVAQYRNIFNAMKSPIDQTTRAVTSLHECSREISQNLEREGNELDRLDLKLHSIRAAIEEERGRYFDHFKIIRYIIRDLWVLQDAIVHLRKQYDNWNRFLSHSDDLITPQLFNITQIEEKLNRLAKDGRRRGDGDGKSKERTGMVDDSMVIEEMFELFKTLFLDLSREAALLKQAKKDTQDVHIHLSEMENRVAELERRSHKSRDYYKMLYKSTRDNFAQLGQVQDLLPQIYRHAKNRIDATLRSGSELRLIDEFCDELKKLIDHFILDYSDTIGLTTKVLEKTDLDPKLDRDDEKEDIDFSI